MHKFIIRGGTPLSGTLKVGGNKNAALKMLPACLLTAEPVTLHNVPNIGDVRVTLELLQKLGASVTWLTPHSVRVHTPKLTSTTLDPALAGKIRASIVLAGPLLARGGRAELAIPGGDSIGERRLDAHVYALKKLGATLEYHNHALILHAPNGLHGADILLPEASVTATENALMAAAGAVGTTTLRNAASEPHIQNLCDMLQAMGVAIQGNGTNRLIVTGSTALLGCETRIGADFMEVGSLVAAAVMTHGEVLLQEADPQYLDMVALTFERLGVQWEVRGNDLFVPNNQRLTIAPDLGNRLPIIKAQPWPGFPPDLMSIALVVATQCVGSVLFHDWMYESRFFFTDKLVRMGAHITLCDPHRVLVQGPTTLQGVANITSPDIRAGMAMVLAALAAKGETVIANIQQIDRGYERIDERLRQLGAHIERVEDTTLSPEESFLESQSA